MQITMSNYQETISKITQTKELGLRLVELTSDVTQTTMDEIIKFNGESIEFCSLGEDATNIVFNSLKKIPFCLTKQLNFLG